MGGLKFEMLLCVTAVCGKAFQCKTNIQTKVDLYSVFCLLTKY